MKKEDADNTTTIKVKPNKEIKENYKDEKGDLRKKRTSKEIKFKEENLKGKSDKTKKQEHKNPVVKKVIKKKVLEKRRIIIKRNLKFLKRKRIPMFGMVKGKQSKMKRKKNLP
jgi:hypothetical protein